jgi:putative DNA primase/helicase
MTDPKPNTEKNKAKTKDKTKDKTKVKKVATGKKKKTGTNGAAPGAAQPANNAQPAPAGNRPMIQMASGEHSAIVNDTETMLIKAGVPLYQRGEALVRPIIREVDASHGRRTKVAQLVQLNPTYARDLMCQHCDYYRFDKREGEWIRTLAPIAIANTLLARNGDWHVPVIVGCLSCQTLRPDGSLLTQQGYDPATRLLLVEPPPMPPFPQDADADFAYYFGGTHPFGSLADLLRREDALQAMALLKELLVEFPFVDDVSRAVALSAIITPIVRGAFPVTPMHVARAAVAGSGKSFLWDITSAIAIGQLMPVMAAGANEEELEKRLGASLMAGQPLISIDNVNGELGGAALCEAIERPIVDVRILGKSENVRIESRGTSIYCTGNNVMLRGDLCRRAITCTLDPEMERPELRQFEHDPIAMILENRGKYIAACLTIVRAYILAGRPNRAPKLASFEGWSDNVRSALMWLGEKDPVASMEISYDEDPERIELADMISTWADEFEVGYSKRKTLAEVIEVAEECSQQSYSGGTEPNNPELLSILQQITKTRRGQQLNILALGRWLRDNKGKIVSNKRFANKSNPKGGSTWWLEEVIHKAVDANIFPGSA